MADTAYEIRPIGTNGITLNTYEAKPDGESKGLVVMCHGFPELGYSWRHQLPALAAVGYHAVAPDLRGYGGSTVPDAIEDYSMDKCCADVTGLIHALGYEKAVLIGHDFGGLLVWSMPFYQPDVVAGVASICTPFTPRAKHEPIAMFNHIYGEDNYINRFQEPGFMEPLFDADIEKTFRMLMRRDTGDGTPLGKVGSLDVTMMEWWKHVRADVSTYGGEESISAEEFAYYAEQYKRAGGFRGGMNWYRNLSRGWEMMEQYQPAGSRTHFDWPVLMMMPDLDPSSPPMLADAMPKFCKDYEYQLIENASHWAQQEQPEQVNRYVTDWLERKFA